MKFASFALPLLLVACGSDSTDIVDTGTKIIGTCINGGSVTGCLVFESDTCNGDIALSSAKGGHFYIESGHLIVNLAANNDNVQVTFEAVDTMGLIPGVQYTSPDQLILTMYDNTDIDEPIRYNGCQGTLTIDSYTAGQEITGTFDLKAATAAGSCGVSAWYTTEGTFSAIPFCEAKDG